MKKIAYLIFLVSLTTSLKSQSECHMFHRKNCIDKEKMPMRYDSQSKSAIMSKGQTSEFHLIAHSGLNYRVSICCSEMLGDQVHLKIYEKHRVKLERGENHSNSGGYDDYSNDSYNDAYSEHHQSKQDPKYKLERELVYDNAEDNFNKSLEFTAESTKSLIISIEVPGQEGESTSKNKLKIKETACVGVLIEHAKTAKSGF